MRGSAAFRSAVAPGGVLAGPWVKNALWRRARAVPSLDLRFAENKSLVNATTGQNLVTFTRASRGTYVDSQGVIRTATTNLLLRSEEFGTTWTAVRSSITADAATAPNNTLTADKLVEDTTATNSHQLQQSATIAANTTYTVSCFIKAAERSELRFLFVAGVDGINALFNLGTGIATAQANTGSGSIVSASLTPVGNGWFRAVCTGIVSPTSTAATLTMRLISSGANSYTGDGTSGLFLWGAQLEQSSTVGEYIPTTSTINSAPRFDHNPTTGESLGLLVEESRTNLVTWSQDFSQTDWSKNTSTIVATAVASPIQGVNYQKIEATSANTTVGITSVAVTAATQQRAVSFFAQPLGNISRVLVVVQGADARINVNLVDGTFTTNAAATGSTVSVSGQRFSVSTPSLTNATGVRFFLKRTGETDTNTPTTIAIGEGLYLIGAQMEAGSFPTSYIPTTTATVTRSADVASITGSNFSSWYRQDEGTMFGDSIFAANTNTRLISANTNATSNRVMITRGTGSNGNFNFVVTDASVVQVNSLVLGSNLAAGSSNKVAAAYKATDFAGSVNGSTVATQQTGTVPLSLTQLTIGNGESLSGNTMTGTIKRLTYFPTRLANETLQRITQ
jgi:hypothetical protein